MSRRTLVLAALLLAGGLAGCIGEDGQGEDVQPASQDQASPNASVETAVLTETVEGAVDVGIATPLLSFNSDTPATSGTFQIELDRDSQANGYVLTLEWDASTPASENLDLWVRDASEGSIPPDDPTQPLAAPPVATATGASPLELLVHEDDLDEDTDYLILVRAPSDMGAGVTVNQPFELTIDTYIGLAPSLSGNATASR